MLVCYFPLVFTPPAADPDAVSRGALVASLEATLTACPLFAPFFIPIALEKLSSTLRLVNSRPADHDASRQNGEPLIAHLPLCQLIRILLLETITL